jgi:hypothetical membrane protein
MTTKSVRRAALGGVIGPAAFVGSWALLGTVSDNYSALHDPISDLAGVHASTRMAMTAGFVVFSVGMGFYAQAVRSELPGPAWIAAATTAGATLAVAALPLHHSPTVDRLHGISAGTGYVTLAATALLSAAPLARLGRPGWARFAVGAGSVSAASLALTLTGSFGGFFQRLGLTAGDAFVVASAMAIASGRWGRA